MNSPADPAHPDTEARLRGALRMDELSLGEDHPTVAIRLNHLVRHLLDNGKPAEAEPLMRRAVLILLKIIPTTGSEHPNTRNAVFGYAGVCQLLHVPTQQFWRRLDAMFEEADVEGEAKERIIKDVFEFDII